MQLEIIKDIAINQIESLLELQSDKTLLLEVLKETKAKEEFKNADITLLDFYEDISKSLQIWEIIKEDPHRFLQQEYFHNLDHIKEVIQIQYSRLLEKYSDQEINGILKKIVISKLYFDNDN